MADRDDVLREAARLGWTDCGPNSKGYNKLKCPKKVCAGHITWVHKTPSNPNYWNERIEYLRTICLKSPGVKRPQPKKAAEKRTKKPKKKGK